MFERIRHMLVKEFIQIFRDPKMRGVIFLMPVIQTLVFGYAVTTDVRHVRTAVYDLDHSVASRELTSKFVRSGYFDLVADVSRETDVRELMDRGTVRAVLQINRGFGGDLAAGRTASVQVVVDGTDSNTAAVVLDYAARITRSYSKDLLTIRMAALPGSIERPGVVEVNLAPGSTTTSRAATSTYPV